MKKVLFIGLGSIGQRHLRNLMALNLSLEYYAIRKRNLPLPEEFSKVKINYVKGWSEIPQLNIDICIIAAPPSFQQEVLPKVVDLGIDFFVEKPIGTDLSVLKSLSPKIVEKKLITMVGFNLRHHPIVLKVKNIINSGVLGRLTSFRAEVGQYLPDWHPKEDYRLGYSANRNLGGGVVLDLIHEIDLADYFFGPLTQVKAILGTNSGLQIDVEDSAEIICSSESGIIGSIHLDYVNRFGIRSGHITGTTGFLKYNLLDATYELKIVGGDITSGKVTFDRNDMYINQIEEFIAACKNRVEVDNNFKSRLQVLAYAMQALEGNQIN